ncbi:MAG TPA: HEPN domain-containing protein [Chloroflexota bacterium]
MNRADFQALAQLRLDDAQTLLSSGRPEGAYYLCGYAVECALKACIAKQTQQHDFPPRRAQEFYTHNLKTLLKLAGLEPALAAVGQQDPQLVANWATVKDWTEDSRYQRRPLSVAITLAIGMYRASADPAHGVLQWLAQYW